MPTPLCVFDNPDVTGIGVRTAIWVQALLIVVISYIVQHFGGISECIFVLWRIQLVAFLAFLVTAISEFVYDQLSLFHFIVAIRLMTLSYTSVLFGSILLHGPTPSMTWKNMPWKIRAERVFSIAVTLSGLVPAISGIVVLSKDCIYAPGEAPSGTASITWVTLFAVRTKGNVGLILNFIFTIWSMWFYCKLQTGSWPHDWFFGDNGLFFERDAQISPASLSLRRWFLQHIADCLHRLTSTHPSLRRWLHPVSVWVLRANESNRLTRTLNGVWSTLLPILKFTPFVPRPVRHAPPLAPGQTRLPIPGGIYRTTWIVLPDLPNLSPSQMRAVKNLTFVAYVIYLAEEVVGVECSLKHINLEGEKNLSFGQIMALCLLYPLIDSFVSVIVNFPIKLVQGKPSVSANSVQQGPQQAAIVDRDLDDVERHSLEIDDSTELPEVDVTDTGFSELAEGSPNGPDVSAREISSHRDLVASAPGNGSESYVDLESGQANMIFQLHTSANTTGQVHPRRESPLVQSEGSRLLADDESSHGPEVHPLGSHSGLRTL